MTLPEMSRSVIAGVLQAILLYSCATAVSPSGMEIPRGNGFAHFLWIMYIWLTIISLVYVCLGIRIFLFFNGKDTCSEHFLAIGFFVSVICLRVWL